MDPPVSRYADRDVAGFASEIADECDAAGLKSVRIARNVRVGYFDHDMIFYLEPGQVEADDHRTPEEARIHRRIVLHCGKHSISATFDLKFGWMTYINVPAFVPKTPTGDDDLVLADLFVFTQMLTVVHSIIRSLTDAHFPTKKVKA